MTVGELIERLGEYPDFYDVMFEYDREEHFPIESLDRGSVRVGISNARVCAVIFNKLPSKR